MENCSAGAVFTLEGFGGLPEVDLFLSVLFFVPYSVTLVGNIGMIAVISLDSRLHTPMYFFLKNLSFLDLCYSSVITPKALLGFSTGRRAISYHGCATQMFFFSLFGTTEAFFLAAMAYDRFVAVCDPLRYPMRMSTWACRGLVFGSYLSGCLNSSIQTGFTFSLSFCGLGKIDHFFCDVPAVMRTSSSDTITNERVMLVVCGLIIVNTGMVVLVSYGCILATILRMSSAEGRRHAFSTCASHLVAVSLFFGTVFFMYAQPGAVSFPGQSKVVSVFYTVLIPMLNPLIYSLRNKEVKEALRRQLKKKSFSH